jgi:hypothetical protein
MTFAALAVLGTFLAWERTGIRTFRGEIQDSACASTAPHVGKKCALLCVRNGARFVLYDSAQNRVYEIDDQAKPRAYAAEPVVVKGILRDGQKEIHLVSIEPDASGVPSR